MPCSKVSTTKTYKCDEDGCLCILTNGAARVCLSVNEMGYIVRCNCDCNTNCQCNENCTCINTAGLTCICVCHDQRGMIKTCEDCSCQQKQAQTQSCKGKNNVTCCCNTGNEKCACLNCSCCESGKNKRGKGSYVTTCKGKKAESGCECKGKSTCACNETACKSKQVEVSFKDRTRHSTNCCGNCDENCVCSCVEQEDAHMANVCARMACSGNCKCQGNANSCVCICKNKQGETVCCDDCKCDSIKTCDKKGCVCVRKESSCMCKSVQTRCYASCDDKCKCTGRKPEAASKAKNCTGSCIENCKCQGNAYSCVCVCKDKQGENHCCDDCKCEGNNRCDKEGCVCIRKESTFKSMKINYCENCDEKYKCSCVERNAAIKAYSCAGKACEENCKCNGNANSCVCICKNEQGETICCDDCKCDNNNICDNKQCVCVPKKISCKGQSMKPICCENCYAKCKCSCIDQKADFNANSCAGDCKCLGNGNSCVCICKNKQGQTVCCDDCKCDNNNICGKKGCVCVPEEDSCKVEPVKQNCCEKCDAKCKCSCLDQEAVFNANYRDGKVCVENCKCQGNGNSCVCICMNKQKFNNGNGNCTCLGNANSCVCLCKNKQEENICCEDCKCDGNNRCDKKGCACIPGACHLQQKAEPKCCCLVRHRNMQ